MRYLWLVVLAACGSPGRRPNKQDRGTPAGVETIVCGTGTDCPSGYVCNGGRCEAEPVPTGGDCQGQQDCPPGQYCNLIDDVCVACLIDAHCDAGETCEGGFCRGGGSGGSDGGGGSEGEGGGGSEGEGGGGGGSGGGGGGGGEGGGDSGGCATAPQCGPSVECTPTAVSEVGKCSDGVDNDCDGEPDAFDSDCGFVDCGEPASADGTDACSPEYPKTDDPMLCELYPSGQGERCMQVCRSRSDCPVGFACYPSRRSVNLHFCAPVLGADVRASGESCSSDGQCATALCHAGYCREVCVRDADCGGGDMICRAEIRTHAYIPNEIATGICVPRDSAKLPLNAQCNSGSSCQSGVCSQSMVNGDYSCSKPCGSEADCGSGQRCGSAIYDNNPNVGFGFRNCAPAPQAANASVGESCYYGAQAACYSYFCDSTYYISDSNFLLEPYCSGHCDVDSDCPLLYPGVYNLRMRCLVGSSNTIYPLIGGYCAPHWCNTHQDCTGGAACFVFNEAGWGGLPVGICQ